MWTASRRRWFDDDPTEMAEHGADDVEPPLLPERRRVAGREHQAGRARLIVAV
jgi:hypothetical protein